MKAGIVGKLARARADSQAVSIECWGYAGHRDFKSCDKLNAWPSLRTLLCVCSSSCLGFLLFGCWGLRDMEKVVFASSILPPMSRARFRMHIQLQWLTVSAEHAYPNPLIGRACHRSVNPIGVHTLSECVTRK